MKALTIITLILSLSLATPALAGKSSTIIELGPNSETRVYDVTTDSRGNTTTYDISRDKWYFESQDNPSSRRSHDRHTYDTPGVNVFSDDDE